MRKVRQDSGKILGEFLAAGTVGAVAGAVDASMAKVFFAQSLPPPQQAAQRQAKKPAA
jgi:hypothetical protein